MARMYPAELVVGAESSAEELLFHRFSEDLPDDFIVLHGIRWLSRTARGWQKQGEIDFLILHPDLGGLVLEVKGGRIGVDGERGDWWSIDAHGRRHPIKDPFAQASDSMHALREKLDESPTTAGHFIWLQHGVAFPDVRVDREGFGPHAPRSSVIDADDLWSLEKAVRRVFGSPPNGYRLTPAAARALIDLLKPSREIKTLALGPRILTAEQRIIQLTQEQYRVLDLLQGESRAAIRGCAGSGKTMLALEKARRLAREGFRVLFTCFNRPLAEWIETGLAADATIPDGAVHVRHFHGLAHDLCAEAGVSFDPPSDPEAQATFWDSEVPVLLLEALEQTGKTFDAVVVDEGQDFLADWWDALQALLDDPANGAFYIFLDDAQSIYGGEVSLPKDMRPLNLTQNCRNTEPIHDQAMRYHGGTPRPRSSGIEGPAPETIPLVNGDVIAALRQVFAKLFARESIPASHVVVLTPRTKSKSALAEGERVGNVTLTWDAEPPPNAVRVSTIHRFKGLDSPIVILAELDQMVGWPNHNELLYVALSRARSHLFILGECPEPLPASNST